jgi:hypothetical protein
LSLLPEDAPFLEYVQAFFLAFRGDGTSLSPLDMQLLHDWRDQGVPRAVVCRGIRRAAESLLYGERKGARLRTLRSCRVHVEGEFRRYRGLSVGRTQAEAEAAPAPLTFAQKRHRGARAELKKALAASFGPEPEARARSRAAEAGLRALGDEAPSDPAEVARRIARADEAQALTFARALPPQERRALAREARRLAGPRSERASARARKDALRAHLVALARARGSLALLV